jgi:hypothetical protein
MAAEDASWELLQEVQDLYPEFQLMDEMFLQAGRDVMTDVHYSRRRPISG